MIACVFLERGFDGWTSLRLSHQWFCLGGVIGTGSSTSCYTLTKSGAYNCSTTLLFPKMEGFVLENHNRLVFRTSFWYYPPLLTSARQMLWSKPPSFTTWGPDEVYSSCNERNSIQQFRNMMNADEMQFSLRQVVLAVPQPHTRRSRHKPDNERGNHPTSTTHNGSKNYEVSQDRSAIF